MCLPTINGFCYWPGVLLPDTLSVLERDGDILDIIEQETAAQ
jgi:hypothetical protein